MTTICIEVDPEVAEAYQKIDPKQQQQIQIFLKTMLKKVVNPRPLLVIMEEASNQAIANGMTPAILQSILNAQNSINSD